MIRNRPSSLLAFVMLARLHVVAAAAFALPVFLHSSARVAAAQLDSSDFTGEPEYDGADDDDRDVEPPVGFGLSATDEPDDVDREDEQKIGAASGFDTSDDKPGGDGERGADSAADVDEADHYDTDGDGLPDDDDPKRGK
jgi:hypothetical protein